MFPLVVFALVVFPLKGFRLISVRRYICDTSLIDRLTINYFDMPLKNAAKESGLYLKTLHGVRRLDVRHGHVTHRCGARAKAAGINQPVEVG